VTANTGVPVLQHSTKKPGCGAEIMAYFRAQKGLEDLKPSEVVIVGDRLTTDVVMANRMGAYSIWVKDGVRGWEGKSLVSFDHDCYVHPMKTKEEGQCSC
jgi:HAD superfamily phosphatase (TIGR01668 family)